MKFPTYEEMAQNVAEKALDEYEYKGKTLRQWIEIIYNSEHGTNLAEVGTEAITKQQAIDALRKLREEDIEDYGCEIPEGFNQDHLDRATFAIKQLPPIQPKRGRWIKLDMHRGMADHKCTACEQECYVPTCMGEPMYAFCPNCGADMRQKGENSESD